MNLSILSVYLVYQPVDVYIHLNGSQFMIQYMISDSWGVVTAASLLHFVAVESQIQDLLYTLLEKRVPVGFFSCPHRITLFGSN